MRPTLQSPRRPARRADAPPPRPRPRPQPRPANVPPSEPAPELVAHFHDPKTRKRLLGHLKWRFVPERNREDVVQITLADAWKRRHSWPKTAAELDKLLFAMLRGDGIDMARKERRAPLLRGEAADAPAATSDDANADEDPPEPGGVTVSTEPQEERQAIREALDYADSRPRLKHPMRWLLQMYMGMTAREIARCERVTENVVYVAVSDLRAELRAKFGRVFIALAIASVLWAIVHFVRIGRVNDQAHPPQTVPTVVSPPPAPAPSPAPAGGAPSPASDTGKPSGSLKPPVPR
jgi:DNA-directed RNA polymerase specialized sigma24 family protein